MYCSFKYLLKERIIMKKILVLLLLCLSSILIAEELCIDCQAILPKKVKENKVKELNITRDNITKECISFKIPKKEEIINIPNRLLWIEIVVEDELDIYQLALKYYGNRDKYQQIYQANKNIIGTDLKIKNGMELKIPITEDFIEQPMFLNRD